MAQSSMWNPMCRAFQSFLWLYQISLPRLCRAQATCLSLVDAGGVWADASIQLVGDGLKRPTSRWRTLPEWTIPRQGQWFLSLAARRPCSAPGRQLELKGSGGGREDRRSLAVGGASAPAAGAIAAPAETKIIAEWTESVTHLPVSTLSIALSQVALGV